MIVIDELPFSFVEGKGFREFIRNACPRFDIPSQRTVTRDVLQLYVDEKAMLKRETIGKLIETCLLDWGIKIVCTITVDNASENKSAIEYMKKKMSNWKADVMVLAGEFMHLRCCAHIINLIVKDGLKELDESIASIRNIMKYIRSSPSRLKKFKSCAKLEKIDCGRVVVMDGPTRWNLTYLMLETALIFQKAFERMEDDDEFYNSYFNESDNGRKKEGPPNMVHWDKAKKFVRFLKTFYNVTLKFSATLSVTSNMYFNEICKILSLLNSMSGLGDLELATMATNMKKKFNKYWSSADQVNKLLTVSIVFDPRGCSNSGTNGTQTSNIVQLSSQNVTFEVDPNDFLVSFRKLKERKLDIAAQNEVESSLLIEERLDESCIEQTQFYERIESDLMLGKVEDMEVSSEGHHLPIVIH
ncbi:hypothetical protein EZV62_018563 [Acer yangbiense]|uniref:hAT-like transposase RNase-H fold domain-containing protein n=1 Tax=Acer yangbiense TaxID=1000413 RepID=A0A5C7HJN8_9ROSI|nr:hypothetical protein EZV62_018563 [Acer yangbiense]